MRVSDMPTHVRAGKRGWFSAGMRRQRCPIADIDAVGSVSRAAACLRFTLRHALPEERKKLPSEERQRERETPDALTDRIIGRSAEAGAAAALDGEVGDGSGLGRIAQTEAESEAGPPF